MTDTPPPPHGDADARMPTRGRIWLPALLLVASVFAAYMRVWHAGFIWDDDDHLTRNPCIVGPLGFAAIWTSGRAIYYPLVLTSFWVQHLIWGLNPLPYHIVDVALHAGCGVLLWLVLRRLNVPGAWLGAAIWVLHPVQVESAAWITEQKNTQSCLFYLLSVLFFVKWLGGAQPAGENDGVHRKRDYLLALGFATLAILSKSSTVMLPVVLGLCWWRMDGRWRWGNVGWLAPFFAVSFAASVWTIWEQKYVNHAMGSEWSQTWPERAVIAGKDIWFYLWKLAWPHPLIFIYHRWNPEARDASAFLPLIAVIVVMLLIWMGRGGALRGVFFAMAYFVVSLFPVLGFFNVYFFRYSFVGDHFQYLASIGPLALAGAGIAWVCKLAGGEKGLVYKAASGAVLVVLGMLTWLQCGVYDNLETLWVNTLAENPEAYLAHFNLADILVRQGHLDAAVIEYRDLLRLVPTAVEGRGNLANVLLMQGHVDEAIRQYEELLLLAPNSPEVYGNLSSALLTRGRVDEAIAKAQTAVELAGRPDKSGEDHNEAAMLRILAAAYEKAHRYIEAVATERLALQRATAQPNPALVAALTRELQAYETNSKAAP